MKRKRRTPAHEQDDAYHLVVHENGVRWGDLYRARGPLAELEMELDDQVERITDNGNGGAVSIYYGTTCVHRTEVPPQQPRKRRKRTT